MELKYTALKVGRSFLRMLYGPMKLRPTRKKILMLSRQSNEPTLDMTLLSDYLRQAHPDLEQQILCRKLEGGSMPGYGAHMLKQMWHMANSAVILLDGYSIVPCVFRHKAGTKVVQMWHSLAAVKQFGYQSLGKPGGRSPRIAEILCMHRNYDVILAPSKATGEHYCRAFDAEPSKLLYMGLPRIDVITAPSDPKGDIREEYDIDPDRKVLLYAPTIRKDSQLRIGDLIEALRDSGYLLVICPHPLDESRSLDDADTAGGDELIIDRSGNTYRWLASCDAVITDYSALSVEASLRDKPVYFYVYDVEEYRESEGLNVDPRMEMEEVTALDAEELVALIQKDYPTDKLEEFRGRYVDVDTKDCTAKLGEYLYGLAEETD